MIAIGGVIGAGLFVGSGVVIADTGPGSFLTYAMAGVLIIMVMRMLAEMAVANPSTGSFADYSRNALATHGPLDLWEATQEAAQARLDHTLSILRSDHLEADGAVGDQRPLRALAKAVDAFHPDQIVIATLPPEYSVWHRFDVVDRARAEHGVPVTHVVATPVEMAKAAR
jgi:hypothetical protein